MSWFDRGSAQTQGGDDPSEGSGPTPAATAAETEAPALRMARAFITPLRTEVGRVDGPECDRPLRQLLGELQYDLDGGLTSHSAERAEEQLAAAMPVWFEGRRASETERVEQFAELLSTLGESLFKMENRDDKSTARIRDGLTNLEASGARGSHVAMKRIVANVVRALDEMKTENERHLTQMSAKIRELHDEIAEKTLEAQIDRLTGINNRATFDDHLARVIKHSRLAPFRFSLLIIDIDHFKEVNDTFGHLEGDRVLKRIAVQLEREVMRKGDFIARYGGEEFAVVLGDCDAEASRKVAERVREAVQTMEIKADGQPLEVTVSIGVAEGCRSDSENRLIRRADDCLYIAKRNGRNRVIVAGSEGGRRVRLPPKLLDRAKAARKAKRADALVAAPRGEASRQVGSVNGLRGRR